MMFEHKQLQNLQDYFTDLNNRREKGVYFYRINNYSEEIKNFILKYYEEARKTGVVIEGKIPNPTEKNLEYYNEIMGMNFQMSVGFIGTSLKKWLPRMNDYQRQTIKMPILNLCAGCIINLNVLSASLEKTKFQRFYMRER